MPSQWKRGGRASGGQASRMSEGFRNGGDHIRHSIQEIVEKLIATASMLSDAEEGKAKLSRLMEAAFGAKYGKEMAAAKRRVRHLTREYERLVAGYEAAVRTDEETPEWVPASRINHDRDEADHVETPFAEWQARDKVEAGVIALVLPLALSASLMSAHANIVGTGLPVFIENPTAAWTLAAMAPMASVALKSVGKAFSSDRGRAVFRKSLNAAAVVAVVSWIALFAEQFHGFSTDGIGAGLFDDPSPLDRLKETAFVALTLSAEVLIGAVLALRLDSIAATYAPHHSLRNAESESAQKRRADLAQRVEITGAELGAAEGAVAEFDEALALQVNLATLIYDARRARNSTEIL